MGLPNTGKTTVFNALTSGEAEVAGRPFTTIERNIGVVPIPDIRLSRLSDLLTPEVCTPTTLEFVDIAGLVKGASEGAGLGNRFLSHARECELLVHIVRCFDDPDVSHAEEQLDPLRDREIVDLELMLADLDVTEGAIARRAREVRGGAKTAAAELETLDAIRLGLAEGRPIRALGLDRDALAPLQGFRFLTAKPMAYVANVSDDEAALGPNEAAARLELAPEEGEALALAAKIEAELIQLQPEERAEFFADLGIEEPGLVRLVRMVFRKLDLITFYTTDHDKLRAWQVPRGSSAVAAAELIHSDMARGFIRAQVTDFATVEAHGGLAMARNAGQVRTEGRDYTITDGDVVHFAFRS